MVTVVTIKTAAGTVSKIPSQSSQPSHSPAFPVPIGRSADREMVSQGEIAPWLWVAAVQHRMCRDDGTHAAVDDTVYRRCGQGSRRSRIPLGEPTALCSRRMKVS